VEEPLIELIVGRHSAYVKDSDWWLLRQATDTQHTFLTRFEVLYAKRLHRGGIVKVPVFLSFFYLNSVQVNPLQMLMWKGTWK
jgi:hypothetical protein